MEEHELLKLPQVGHLEATAIQTKYDSIHEFRQEVEENHEQLRENEPWYKIPDKETVLELLPESDGSTPTQSSGGAPETFDGDYQLLGKDDEHRYLHYYRFQPTHLEILLVDEENLEAFDRMEVLEGDPETRLQEYQHYRPWKFREEIKSPDYRLLPEPVYSESPNQHFDGTIHLDDGDYMFPFRAPFSTVADILESQTCEDDAFHKEAGEFIDLATQDSLDKYRLVSKRRGPKTTGRDIIGEIQVVEKGSNNILEEINPDKLAEEHYVELLSEIDGVDLPLADLFIQEYGNLRTVSWALTSDTPYMENTYDVDCHQLLQEFQDADVYRGEHNEKAGTLNFPERRADELSEDKQHRYFGEILEPEVSTEESRDSPGEQSGITEY